MWHWSLPILPEFPALKILYALRFSSPKSQVKEANLDITTIYTFLNAFFLPYLRHHPNTPEFPSHDDLWWNLNSPPWESHRVSWTVKWHSDLHRPRVSPQGVGASTSLGCPWWCWGQRAALEDDTVPSVLWQSVWQMVAGELWLKVHHSLLNEPPPLTQAPESATEPGLPKRLMAALGLVVCTLWFARSGHSLLRRKPHLHAATKW